MKSQEQAVLDYLKRGKPLTPMEALQKFRCFRLAARIYRLREAGYRIITREVKRGGKRFAEYTLS